MIRRLQAHHFDSRRDKGTKQVLACSPTLYGEDKKAKGPEPSKVDSALRLAAIVASFRRFAGYQKSEVSRKLFYLFLLPVLHAKGKRSALRDIGSHDAFPY